MARKARGSVDRGLAADARPRSTTARRVAMKTRSVTRETGIAISFLDLAVVAAGLRGTRNCRPHFRVVPLRFPAHDLAEGGSNVYSQAPEQLT